MASGTKKIISKLAAVILIAILGFAASRSTMLRANVGNKDSIQYWASGRLLLNHQNPYDPSSVLRVERSETHIDEEQVRGYRPIQRVFRVPPWGLIFDAPLGLLDPFWAWFVWFSCSAAAIVFSVRICRELFGVEGRVAHDCALAAYLFAPVLACLEAGQIAAFLLLGVLLFLRWETRRPFWAGAALLLPFAKPHLFFLFGGVCVLWMLSRRRWTSLTGFAVALVGSLAVALWFDPAVFAHYRGMVAQEAIGDEFIPALAGVFRMVVAHRIFWVQFLPAAVGLGWAIWYWGRHRQDWNWREHGILVLLVSVLVSPYSWFPDEIVLLPVIYCAAAWLFSRPQTKKIGALIAGLVALNAVLLVMAVVQVSLPSGAYVWSGLAWASWFALGARAAGRAMNPYGQPGTPFPPADPAS